MIIIQGEPLDDKPAVTESEKPKTPAQKQEETSVVKTPSNVTIDSLRSETSNQSARSRPSTTSSLGDCHFLLISSMRTLLVFIQF